MAAEAITVVCPNCKKQVRVPADAAGKKVRCKGCEEVFAVKAPPAPTPAPKKPPEPPKPPPAPAPAAKHGGGFDDDDDGPASYGVVDDKIGARCPHCANPIADDQIICLNCGYNTRTRSRVGSKKTYDRTEQDYFMWLLPGFLCVGGIFALIGLDIFLVLSYPKWIKDTFELTEDVAYFNPASLWTVIGSLFGIVPCFVFAVRRLIFHPTPPEVEKKDVKED